MEQATPGTLTDRAVIRLRGDDVRGFLQGLVTNDVAGPLPVWTGLLTPQGKALFDFLVWADGDDLLLDVEAAEADAIVKRLSLYRLRRPIAIGIDTEMYVQWFPNDPDITAARDPRLADLGFRRLDRTSLPPAKGWAAHRLSLGVVEGAAELGRGETLWLECNARELNGVSFTKGCYIGQENTARMHHRAKVNRRLVVVPLGEPGDRSRKVHADLDLTIEHRRVEAMGNALRPTWLNAAMTVTD